MPCLAAFGVRTCITTRLTTLDRPRYRGYHDEAPRPIHRGLGSFPWCHHFAPDVSSSMTRSAQRRFAGRTESSWTSAKVPQITTSATW